MKCFKKVAALLFCVVLALSVMAVSAFADDEAQLLNTATGVGTNVNAEFTVMLTKSAGQTEIRSRDTTPGYEINATNTVDFDIWMAYRHVEGSAQPSFTTTPDDDNNNNDNNINGFQFVFNPANNYGATITKAIVYKDGNTSLGDIWHASDAGHATLTGDTTDYEHTYTYSALTNYSKDINLPTKTAAMSFSVSDSGEEVVTNAQKIATITLAFANATQAIDIYPQIENLMIQLRGGVTEQIQQPVAATFDNTSGTTYGTYYNGSSSDAHGTVPNGNRPDNTSITPNYNQYTCVIKAPIPVIVNPIYTVKLEQFKNNDYTGILEKVMTTDASPVPATIDYLYDFKTGSFTVDGNYSFGSNANAKLTVLPNASTLTGYTLKGWMVTKSDDGSATWAKYDKGTFNSAWEENTSYPATTTAMHSQIQWGDSSTKDTNSLADEWFNAANNGKKEFNASYAYGINATDGDTAQPQTGVNFIPVKDDVTIDEAKYTKFPAGLIGNITLTPVYTRNVYVATFNAGDNNATFEDATTTKDATITVTASNSDKTTAFTKQYTIEDLCKKEFWHTTTAVTEAQANDFLSLKDTNGETALQEYVNSSNNSVKGNATGPWGATRKAYKFMGWKVETTETNVGYQWTRNTDDTELVPISNYDDSKNVLKTPNCKHISDVTFTAEWEEDIYYAEIGYQYAGNTNAMILVVVPSGASGASGANFDADYTYQFTSDSGKQNMFIIPQKMNEAGDSEIGQRKTYMDEALKVLYPTESGATVGMTEVTEKLPSGLSGDYVVFAYITTASGDNPENKISIIEKEGAVNGVNYSDGRKNVILSYNGDVDGSGGINVGDFGNVDTLFNNNLDTGENNTANVFKVTDTNGYYGVKARLEADVTTDTEVTGRKFASISDIKFIYDLMGYETNKTP